MPKLSSELLIQRSLRRWVIRTIIGAVLFTFIALNWTWGKWILFIWIPFTLMSLAILLYTRHKLRSKSADIESTIQATRKTSDDSGLRDE